MKKYIKVTLSFLIISIFLLSTGGIKAKDLNCVKIDILSINDFHGALEEKIVSSPDTNLPVMEGAAIMAEKYSKIKENNKEGTIIISTGDMFHGTPLSNVLYGEPVINMMNKLDVKLMAIGNHEFDWGKQKLSDIKRKATFPMISCNIYEKGTDKLIFNPYVIVKVKGVKLGFIGVTTPETVITSLKSNIEGLEFKDPAASVKKYIPELKSKGAEIIFVAGHIGAIYENDNVKGEAEELAEKLKGTDVCGIFSGHTHKKIASYVNGIAVVQGFKDGLYLGHISLTYNKASKKVEFMEVKAPSAYSYLINIQRHKDVKEIVDAAKLKVGNIFNEVLGKSSKKINNKYDEESACGDFVADVIREKAGTDFAFEAAGNIRSDIEKGKITIGSVYSLLPWENHIFKMKLSDNEIKKVLERGASLKMGMIQVSGLEFSYDKSLKTGSRVFNICDNSGNKLNMNTIYTVAVNEFLASGGDGYIEFTKGREAVNTDLMERNVVIDKIKELNSKEKELKVSTDGRIKEEKSKSYSQIVFIFDILLSQRKSII